MEMHGGAVGVRCHQSRPEQARRGELDASSLASHGRRREIEGRKRDRKRTKEVRNTRSYGLLSYRCGGLSVPSAGPDEKTGVTSHNSGCTFGMMMRR